LLDDFAAAVDSINAFRIGEEMRGVGVAAPDYRGTSTRTTASASVPEWRDRSLAIQEG
jgi:hypothetical protein